MNIKSIKAIKIISIVSVLLSIFFFITNGIQIDKEKMNYKSEFYRLVYKNKNFDFIKGGQNELKILDDYIEKYKDDVEFCIFISTQKNLLLREIDEENVKMKQTMHHDFKAKEKIAEYSKIDYIKAYKQYCVDFNQLYLFNEFCTKYGIKDDEPITLDNMIIIDEKN